MQAFLGRPTRTRERVYLAPCPSLRYVGFLPPHRCRYSPRHGPSAEALPSAPTCPAFRCRPRRTPSTAAPTSTLCVRRVSDNWQDTQTYLGQQPAPSGWCTALGGHIATLRLADKAQSRQRHSPPVSAHLHCSPPLSLSLSVCLAPCLKLGGVCEDGAASSYRGRARSHSSPSRRCRVSSHHVRPPLSSRSVSLCLARSTGHIGKRHPPRQSPSRHRSIPRPRGC